MFSVGIIGDIHDWHSQEIEFYLKKNNCKVKKIFFENLIATFSNKEFSLFSDKKKNKIDGVWVRFINKGSLEEITTKLSLLHLLEENKTYVHNSADSIEKTVDKVRTTGILEINGISSPKTIVWFNGNFSKHLINQKDNYLLKPIFGSQGKKIILIKNHKKIERTLANGNVFYLQKFIGSPNEKSFSDIRVLVSNHKVVSAMERNSKKFLTNVFQGANFRIINIDEKLKKLCEKISRIFKLGYGGIDIKIHKKSTFVLEINSIPSWKAMQKVEKNNVSEILVKDFINRLKKKKSNG
jgi:RimK family alpha-L-glutamate ligase